MANRKPAGTSWESWIDRLITEGRERGEFDDLPGTGKPIADLDKPYDEMWWVRKKLEREGVSYLPPTLALRKDREDTLASLGSVRSEEQVRELLGALNGRIRDVNRRSADGPPSVVVPVDIEAAVLDWSRQRAAAGELRLPPACAASGAGAVAHVPVLRNLRELTPAWATAALASAFPGAVVGEVVLGEVADGTNRRAVVRLSYERGSGPSSVFVKAPGRRMHRLALVALGAWAAEAHLAAAGSALPLEHPAWYAAGIDRSRLASLVVTEDVTANGGKPNDATVALRVAEVRSGLEGLAALHAQYWDRPLPQELAFVRQWRLGPAWAGVSGLSLARGIRRLRRATGGAVVPPAVGVRLLEQQFRRSAALAATGPQTLLHGDPHPGNTYALEGDRTGFYDWQLVRRGNWCHDVGYFIVSSLDPEVRRAEERELLARYLAVLGDLGVAPPEFEEAWSRYRASAAFGLCTWLHTIGAGTFQREEVCVETLRRHSAAYRDLGTETSTLLARRGS